MRRFTCSVILGCTISLLPLASAWSQDDNSEARIERLEREINFLQKQVYRGGNAGDPMTTTHTGTSANAEVKLGQMAEELRQLRGALEQAQFANRQTATELKKLSDDMDYRMKSLEEKQAKQLPPAAPAEPAAATAPASTEPAHFDPEKKPAAKAAEEPAKPALTGNDFPDANAHYSYAFKLLNEKKYAEASTSFDGFVKKYPADPLTSNAYYWLGESYYARNDFTRSGESFRKGFEANPNGQKAPDNLFKLAKSLVQVKRANEACIVLSQIIKKYPDTAPRMVKRAEDERLAQQCK